MLRMPGAIRGGRLPVEKIYDLTLSSPGRFDVAGIPAGYSIIKGRLLARSTVSATGDNINIFLNGDTTLTNYRRAARVSGSANLNSLADDPTLAGIPAATATADYFGILEFEISQYANPDVVKIFSAICGERRDATTIFHYATTVHWESKAAINQITLQPDGYATDTFVAGSWLQIWLHR